MTPEMFTGTATVDMDSTLDEILYEVQLPSGVNLNVPLPGGVGPGDQNFLLATLTWIKENEDLMDPVDMFYVNTFLRHPSRTPHLIVEYI